MLDCRGVKPASVGDRNAAGIDQDNVDMRGSYEDEPVKRIVAQLEGDGNEAS